MADEPRIVIQGECHWQWLYLRGKKSYITGKVVPHAEPEAWYIQPFPTKDALDDYCMKHGLTLIDPEEDKSA